MSSEKKYVVMTSARGRSFDTLKEAEAYERAYRKKTGEFVEIRVKPVKTQPTKTVKGKTSTPAKKTTAKKPAVKTLPKKKPVRTSKR